MHKGIILLTKAEDRDEAASNANGFLEEVVGEDKNFNWGVIGGRWTGELNVFSREFYEKLQEEEKKDEWEKLTKEEQTAFREALWVKLREKAGIKNCFPNPFDRIDTLCPDDIQPAKEVESVIKSFGDGRTNKQKAEELLNTLLKEVKAEKADPQKNKLSAYYAQKYAKTYYDYFSEETDVYDIDDGTSEIPSDLTDYYAVMVDLHY